MFKLNPNPTFSARVPLSIPGQAKPSTVDIEYRHFSKTAIKSFFENLEGKTDAEALHQIIVGWKGFDEAFSEEALAVLVDNYPTAATELFTAFRKELMEAREKN